MITLRQLYIATFSLGDRTNGKQLLHLAAKPVLVFVGAFLVYGVSALLLDRLHTPRGAYFDDLAQAFLEGRLYLINPPLLHDLTFYNGHWYVPFPPLVALLLLPWVGISGVQNVNTILFSIMLGAANVTLVFLMLQALSARGWTRLKISDNAWLTVLFGIGTIHWYMTPQGSVWFISQIATVTFIALAAYIAIAFNAPVGSGFALGAAMLARPHVILFYPFLLAVAGQHSLDAFGHLSWRELVKWLLLSLIPVAGAAITLLVYNWMRFGSWLDFGYMNSNVAAPLLTQLRTYGQFSLHFVRHNMATMMIGLPLWDTARGRISPDVEGMSIFITTPALVYLLRALKFTLLTVGAWVSIGLILIPLLTYYNTGTTQFGYRFSLDFMVPIMVLLAVAAGTRVSWLMRMLIIAGILVNAWGVAWFGGPLF
jgi:hypothetical protein